MSNAQGSTEKLMLVGGAVIVVAIVVAALLSYSPTSVAITKKANCTIQEEKQKGLLKYALPGGASPDKVIAAYRLDGDAKDATGKNNGIAFNMTYSDDARNGKSGYFNGTTAYIRSENWAPFNPTTNGLTYSVWIKPTGTANYQFAVSQLAPYLAYYYDGANGYALMHWYPGIGICCHLFSQKRIELNKWHHLAMVYDTAGYAKLYINGDYEGQLGPYTPPWNTNHTLKIGAWRDGPVYPFQGYIDDVVVWGRPLSEKEIKSLAEC